MDDKADARQRIAVVAGGGSGIGRACSVRLGRMGFHVILLGRTESSLAETAKQVEEAGGTAHVFPADVRDWDRLTALQTLTETSGVDLLVNCAGGQFTAPATEISRNGWQAVIDVNLSGSFFLCRLLEPALRQRRGSIVLVVANLWQRVSPGLAHSAAARAGVVNLMRSLALEWAAAGIRVNAVSPGLIDTSGARRYPAYDAVLESVPLGRLGTADEVVDAILYVAQAPYVTGEVLTIDGGLQLL